ncbi:MAG: outer membrane efflux protein [Candidatus Ozemobacter sibiricus]|uniref:Outer membrane efflux protein n=1 Tax=Candidatus Ozemobacter sibiricus TaxID=2268124 RepID=A0A367ZTN2_9BACT|nr:MAG: outer membrane efflux protein [Candidatus Ozemobacter sibiricus]
MVRIPIVGLVLLTAMLGSRPARLAAQAPAVGSEPVAAVVEAVAPAVEAMVPASVPGDLSLGQAVREALAANPDLAVARARLAAAQAAVDGARAAFFPRVSAMVQYNEREYSPSSLGFAGMPAAAGGGTRTSIVQTDGLTFQWPIDLGQRTALALRRARAGERKAASDRRGAESEVIALTIEAFLGVRRAAELLTSARDRATALAAHRELVLRRLDAELAQRTDLLKADVQLESAREAVLLAENALAQAGHVLNQMLGRPVAAPVAVATAALELAVPDLDTLAQDLETANPGLVSLRRQVEVLEQGLRLERAGHRPTLTLSGSRTRTGKDWPPSDPNWAVAAALDWKLFDAGQQQARVAEARARLAEAQAQLEKTRQALQVQLQSAWRQYRTAATRLEVTRKALELAQEEVRLSRLQAEEGLITLTDHLDTQAEFTRAQVAFIVATFDRTLAALRLLQLAGRLDREFAERL